MALGAGSGRLLWVGSNRGSESKLRTQVELAKTGACGEALFWGVTSSGEIAVTVRIDVRSRSVERSTVMKVELPDPLVLVEVLEGHDLGRNFCTDVLDASAVPRSIERANRSEEHTSELQSLMRISYAVFCLKKKKEHKIT